MSGRAQAELFPPVIVSGVPEAGELSIRGEEEVRARFAAGEIGPGDRFLLKAEAWLLQLAHAHNKIMSLSNSRTRILAHQVESTHRIINSLNHRFLIADEVGLGKTVEAGLVIKELQFRYGYRRVLIVCPSSLQSQWQSEMAAKFNEQYDLVDRRALEAARRAGKGENPWMRFPRAICSIDFIKNRDMAGEIAETIWDITVFDEAHRLRRDGKQSTLAYNVAEILSRNTRALLLLSATPFRGKLEELYYLVSLIDRNILGPYHTFYRTYCIDSRNVPDLKGILAPVVIRRTKRGVGGFTRRHARTIRFELYPEERLLYDETTRYVVEEYNRAMATENRAVGFVMTVFQKLLDSSSQALHRALANRLGRLREETARLESAGDAGAASDIDPLLIEESDSPEEYCSLSRATTLAEMRIEIATLERLVAIAGGVDASVKGERLRELLQRVVAEEGKKVVIFTQFMTTQEYLRELLRDYRIVTFNGSMGRDEKDQAVARFKEEADVFISTEAGGEGRNLQFCSVMVNYDLPWSPLKIEQRIGRIHRFGQKSDVYIYNFATRDTVAERVLEILTLKLKVFEQSIGAMDVLLGQMEDEMELGRLFMEMAAGAKTVREVDREIEARIREARSSYEKLSELTVASRMDFNYDEYYRVTLKERTFSNRRIEDFAAGLCRIDRDAPATVKKRKGTKGVYIIRAGGGEEITGTFNSRLALEREDLQFLAFGHPSVDALVRRAQEEDFCGTAGALRYRYAKPFTAVLFLYLVATTSVSETRDLVPVLAEIRGGLEREECREIERELIQGSFHRDASAQGIDARTVSAAAASMDRYLDAARSRLVQVIEERRASLGESLDMQLYRELERIQKSYGDAIGELRQKLDLQESRMKWYGEDLKGAITRTRNAIRKAEAEKREATERYHGYLGIRCRAELLGACIVLGG
ncbi:MAG: DEAD/DEAH box helicase family protein [Spirochaetes bacterium]|nr:DEAD/DEAH box helicase family protein [Spirochaetota bacterium]